FEPDEMLPEAAQGALALQVRAGEEHLVAAADHHETRRRVEAERAAVAAVGGGCLAPVAAHHDGSTLTALIAAEDGSWIERRTAGALRRDRSCDRGSAPRPRLRARARSARPHAGGPARRAAAGEDAARRRRRRAPGRARRGVPAALPHRPTRSTRARGRRRIA